MIIDNKKSWILFIVIIIFFLVVIKERVITYSLNSDENAYFYMAKLISEGNLPYRDFFFAHPPLQLFILALIFKIFGFNFILLKLVPILSIILSSFFLFKIIKYKFGNLAALIGVVLFLFEYNLIRSSTQASGINETLLFILLGFYYFIKNKNIISGLFFGLAGLTGLYSAIPIIIFLFYLLIKNRKEFLNFLLGFSIFFIINLIFFIISNNFITQVYLYHLMKPEEYSLYSPFVLLIVIEKNIVLFLSLVLFLIFYKQLKDIRYIKLILLIVITYIIFFLFLKRPFIFYYILIFPFLAIIGAIGIIELLKKIKIKKVGIIILSLIIMFIIVYALINFNIDYTKTDTKKINELSNFIKVNSKENDLIFGDYYIVPLLSLMTNREIALNEVDTNLMRFQSITDINEVIYRLDNEKRLKYIIIEANRDLAYSKEFVEFTKKCKLIKIDKAENFGEYYIFGCK